LGALATLVFIADNVQTLWTISHRLALTIGWICKTKTIAILLKFQLAWNATRYYAAHLALTITERRSIVKNKLRKKYRKFLKMPRWDESELSEMDERMADDIRRASYFAEHIKQRLGFYRGRK
jgi:hypothetical protein